MGDGEKMGKPKKRKEYSLKKIVLMMMLLLAVVGAKAQEVENPVGRFSVIPRIGVTLANWSGLKNALEVAGKNIADVKIVVNGAGAAAISCTKLNIFLL